MGLRKRLLTGIVASGLLLGGAKDSSGDNWKVDRRDAAVFAANVGFNAAIGCIASKKNNKGCLEGAKKGASAGAISYGAKKAVAANPDYAWPSKLIMGVSTSMMDNLINDDPLFSSYMLRLGPVSLDYKFRSRRLRPTVNVDAIANIVYAEARGYDFDPGKSLRYGVVYYTHNHPGERFAGYSIGSALTINEGTTRSVPKDILISHELVHMFQIDNGHVLGKLIFRSLPEKVHDKAIRLRNKSFTNIDELTGNGFIVAPFHLTLNHDSRPIELEAMALTDYKAR